MTQFEHGAQIVCISNLIETLRNRNKKFEDCKFVLAKQVNEGDYIIDYDDYAD